MEEVVSGLETTCLKMASSLKRRSAWLGDSCLGRGSVFLPPLRVLLFGQNVLSLPGDGHLGGGGLWLGDVCLGEGSVWPGDGCLGGRSAWLGDGWELGVSGLEIGDAWVKGWWEVRKEFWKVSYTVPH